SMRAAQAIGLILLLTEACRDASTPWQPAQGSDATGVVPGQYIVVFRDTVADPEGLAQALVQAQGGTRLHTYTSALKGFAARLSDPAVAALRQNPRVAYVEPDQKGSVAGPQALQRIDQRALPRAGTAMSASANPLVAAAPSAPTTQQMDAQGNPWGLDRIDQRTLPFSGTYTYTSTGAGVHVYIIDTGIWTAHPEFQGRADNVFDFAGGDGTDCFGSGTAVAGVVGAATYGVAKGVFLHGVRVYDCNGAGFRSDLIAGVDWVTAHHASPAVANIAVSLDPDPAFTTAVRSLWSSGVFVTTTAANHNADACLEAGGASGVFTVAASTAYDTKAAFSDWGTCVQIYAPGEYIQSTWLGGQTNIVSGTSYAAPFVAGVAATYKATVGDVPSDAVASWILNNATAGVITENTAGTPNLLLYSAAVPLPAPVANFTFSCAGLACSFDASSSTAQATATYTWHWGDGTPTGSGTTATHSYAVAGTYTVTLTVTDAGGTSKTPQSVTVSPLNQPPVASFTTTCSL
ncbi:MAG TPA: S8 family serine peptidase, partial [Mycobacterium sp.]|nr:S8 family serine peptidase [Mycobacterium sp.]